MSQAPRILNHACSQLDRWLSAPQPEAVAVDGRSLVELLAFAARFGPLLQFWDLNDQRDGDWAAFFGADPAVGHAMHGALDLPEIERGLRQLLRACREARSRPQRQQPLQQLLHLLLRLVALLDRNLPSDEALHSRWGRLLASPRRDSLAAPLQALHLHGAHQPIDACLDAGPDWFLLLLHLLEDLIVILIEALRQGAEAAVRAAEQSLSLRGHAPQAALYNAFALLYAEARQGLNRFPQRLLDFYHAQVLRQTELEATPDQVFLTFTLAQGADSADIARATLFSAGVDEQGLAINYAASSALTVSPAAVSGLRVHRLSYADQARQSLRGVLSGVLSPVQALPESFPVFGAESAGRYGALELAPASLGFAISSPSLMLSGGQRSVCLLLSPSTPTSAQESAALVQSAKQAFALYYSSAQTWIAVQNPSFISSSTQPGSFELSFALPPDAPPLLALSTPAPAGSNAVGLPADSFPAPSDQPTLIAQLQPSSWQGEAGAGDLYQLLTLLELSTITLKVSVQKLTPTALRSPDGPLNPQQTMALLGLRPAQFSSLEIQAPELFAKPINSLSLSIDWVDLPITSAGFLGYYQGYQLNADGQPSASPLFDNQCFQVDFWLKSPGFWSLDSSSPQALFQTSSAADAAANTLLLSSELQIRGLASGSPPPYYEPNANALQMRLSQPSYAFGQALYAINLAAKSSANVATLRATSQSSDTASLGGAASQLAQASAINANASERSHGKEVSTLVQQVITRLNGLALASLQQGQLAPALLQDLQDTLAKAAADPRAWWQRWRAQKDSAADRINAQLKQWAETHAAELAQGPQQLAQGLLDSASRLSQGLADALKDAVALARPKLAAQLQQAQLDLARLQVHSAQASCKDQQQAPPNTPWLPQASAITLNYSAETPVSLQTLVEGDTTTDGSPAGQFLHLAPFLRLQSIAPQAPHTGQAGGVCLLPKVASEAALYIDLSAPTTSISLLFILSCEPTVWSEQEPQLAWEQWQDEHWLPIALLGDGTHGLLNSGIVKLQLLPTCSSPPQLRVRLLQGLNTMPWVSSVTSNALLASWVGPGGAARLGQPLPVGSISQSVQPIEGLASIDQPMVSQGGRPQLQGQAFALWMAERLRHKGFASTEWDYARLCLAAIPTLWQLAVVAATDAQTGQAAPGMVWVIAIAGPGSVATQDPCVPMVDASILAEIDGLLRPLCSPFAQLQISNPPYTRISVQADLIFSDADTLEHWLNRLQSELTRWLSPWPDAKLGPRPPDYYSRDAIAEFIRQRDYVLGIKQLRLHHEQHGPGPRYYTSAAEHDLSGSTGQPA